MAFSLISHTGAGGDSTSVTTSAIDTTGADFIALFLAGYGGVNIAIISDSKSNTWTPRTSYLTGSLIVRATIFYCVSPTVGSGHTFTASDANTYSSICVAAFSGSDLSAPYDVENGATGVSTSRQTGSVTPSVDNELLISGFGWAVLDSDTASVDVGTISDQVAASNGNHAGAAMGYQIQTTATARNPTWSLQTSQDLAASIASFKAVAAAATDMLFAQSVM